jgi:hypothetical protein
LAKKKGRKPMSFGHALYYPHINLTNKNWLKYAVLYWDKISRIVPASVQPTDSEDIIRLRSEIGFVEDYRPEQWDVSMAAQDFFEWFTRHSDDIEMREYFELRHGVPPFLHYPFHRHPMHHGGLADALHAAALASGTYIHVEKLDRRLKEFLFATGIAIPGEDEWRDWIRIDTEVGLLYMSYLARTISAKTSRAVITDELPLFASSEVIASSIAHDRQEELQHRMGTLLIAAYGPADMNAVTFDQLIAFRQKHNDQRRAFFDHVDALCRSIPRVASEDQFKDALNHHMKTLMADAEEVQKQYRDMRIDPVLRFISISVPTACVSLTDYVPVESKGVVLAAGIVLGVANALHERRKEEIEQGKQPLSYLQTLDSQLDAHGLIDRLRDAYRRTR